MPAKLHEFYPYDQAIQAIGGSAASEWQCDGEFRCFLRHLPRLCKTLPRAASMDVAREFFRTGALPRCVEWTDKSK